MAEYRLSSRAEADLAEIADYTVETFGIEQARRYRDELESCFQTLTANPMIGRSADELGSNLRRYEHQLRIPAKRATQTGASRQVIPADAGPV